MHPQITRIDTEFSDFLSRLNYYGKCISEITENESFKVVLLAGITKSDFVCIDLQLYNYVKVFRVMNPSFNVPRFALKARKILHETGRAPTLLISGDLTFGLVTTFYFRKLFGRRIPVELSLHGSIEYSGDRLATLTKGFFRSLILHIFLKRADSIRVVSDSILKELVSRFDLDQSRIFVAPIPFQSFPEFTKHSLRSITIGVIGRLHPERNLSETLAILSLVLPESKIDNVYVIGDGLMKKQVEDWKSNSLFGGKVHLLGRISQNDMLNFWPSISLVISSARAEGYGLAIREALVSGAIVIARRNEGSIKVLDQFSKGIFLFESPTEAAEIIRKILWEEFPIAICENALEIQKKIDRSAMGRLALSWSRTDKLTY
jgi:glycosyltransferase involved in cell wall biosynthesis